MGQSKAALPCCSHWVLHIVVRTCVVVQPYVLPLGSTCHHWAQCIVVGPYLLRLGWAPRHGALCHIVCHSTSLYAGVGLFMSS